MTVIKPKDRTTIDESRSVFAALSRRIYSNTFETELRFRTLRGGIPSDPDVAAGWIRTKFTDTDDMVLEAVAKTMADRGIDENAAAEEVAKNKHLNGFVRHPADGQLCILGRHVKAALKEAASVRWPKHRNWGPSNKSTLSYVAEHIFVPDGYIRLWTPDDEPVMEPHDAPQDFVHTFRGSGIKITEQLTDVVARFRIRADFDMPLVDNDPEKHSWGAIWVTGEQQGIGADRSQGYGTYEVTRFDPI